MTEARIIAQSPILFVKDIGRSVAYWNEKIGFDIVEIYGEPPGFAILSRDTAHVMLASVPEQHEIVPFWKVRSGTWNAYFWVDDVAAMYAEIQKRGATIDYELCDQPYGVREFGIRDLEDQDIGFGQVLEDERAEKQ
jgi:uncharacterized glyoxalase superfamily protein PhnB